MTNKIFTVSAPPHWHCRRTVPDVMFVYITALAPAAILGALYFGHPAMRVIALACATAVLAEALCQKAMKRDLSINDGSALLAGLVFALLLPASAPWWLVIVGAAVTIIIGRQAFGGLGGNPLPAPVIGWAVCRLSWATEMSIDQSMLNTGLSFPLTAIKQFGAEAAGNFSYWDLLLGNQLGAIGTVHVLALFLGGAYLISRGYLKPHIPLSFLVSVFVFASVFHLADPATYAGPVFHLFTGGVMLGAFFIMTESSSSPVNPIAMVLFGALGGALVVVVRSWGIYPDGVPFAILLACLVAPLLDFIRPKAFGKA